MLIPKFVAQIPCDYFVSTKNSNQIKHSSFRATVKTCIQNLLGIFLIGVGALMLLLPGQGLLTILLGILISDFPGKYKFEQYLVKKPAILNSLNWIRRKQNVPELYIK
ncbi:MAG: hypothetical protein R8G33_02315 [Gammaproteobacteria bacterium]|nr:hypothetical protein [Gammaproteobacteria bacterium]